MSGQWDNTQGQSQEASSGRRYAPPAVPPEFQGQGHGWPPGYAADRGQNQPGEPWQPQGYRQPDQPQFVPAPPQHHQPQYAPPPQYGQHVPRTGRKKHTVRNVLAGIGVLVVAIIVISAAANSGHGTQTAGSSQGAAAGQAAAPGKAAAKAAAKAPAAAPANTKPAGTVSELEALTAAKSYLSDGQGFSRRGLIGQLDSSYGNKFSVADATWGVDHAGANWDAQAVDCAKGYVSDGQGFSRQGLIDQMTSAYGNKFTEAQAEYAANAVGL